MTAPGVSAGTVWIDVLPSMKGFGAQIGKEAATSGAAAGAVAGRSFGLAAIAGVVAIAGGALLAGKALFDVGKTFETVTNTIRVGTGATGDALDSLVEDAKNVGRGVPESFDVVGNAVADLNTRLGLTGKPLQDSATQFLNLSRITGTDLQSNIADISRVFGNWGIATEDQAGAMDKMFRASQSSGVGIDTLSQSVVKFGTPMRSLGFSFDETLGMLGQFDKSGLNTDVIMKGMTKSLATMGKAGEEPIDTYRRVTEEIKNLADPTEATALSMEFFGAKAGPEMASAIRDGRLELGGIMNDITNGTDTINAAAAETLTFADSWAILKNQGMAALEPVARSLMDIIGQLMVKLADGIGWVMNTGLPGLQGFGRTLNEWRVPIGIVAGVITTIFLPSLIAMGVQATISAVKTAAAWVVTQVSAVRAAVVHSAQIALMVARWVVLGALSLVQAGRVAVGWLITSAGAIGAAVVYVVQVAVMVGAWVLLGVQSLINAGRVAAAWLIAMGPIGLVIIAVVALVALIIANWDTVKRVTAQVFTFIGNFLRDTWNNIRAGFSTAVAFIAGLWNGFWSGVRQVATAVWNAVSGFIGTVWNAIRAWFSAAVSFLSGLWNGFWSGLRQVGQTVFSAIRGFIDTVWAAIRAGFNAAVAFLRGLWDAWWTGLRTVASTVFNAIKAAIDFVWNAIRAGFNAAVTFLRGLWDNFWSGLRNVASTVFNAIKGAIDFVWNAVKSGFQAATGFVTGLWDRFWTGLRNTASTVFGGIKGAIDTVIGGIIGAFQFVVDNVKRIWNGIREILAVPIRFMVHTVYNKGIVKAWNFVAKLLGIKEIEEIRLPFAKGGRVDGPGTGTSDSINARLSRGEHVWTDKEVRAAGGHGEVERMRAEALRPQDTFRALQAGRLIDGADHNGPGSRRTGFDGVQPHVAQAGHFIQSKFGVKNVGGRAGRPGPSDHPAGLALDFMTYKDSAKGAAISRYMVDNARHMLVKYVIWQQRINKGSGWKGMPDRGNPTANHMDHPHVSFLGNSLGARNFSGGDDTGGGFMSFVLDQVRKLYDGVMNPVPGAIAKLVGNPPPEFRRIPPAMASSVIKSVGDFLFGKAEAVDGASGGGGGGGPGGTGPVADQVRGVANRYGWGGGPQWDALSRLVQKESSWNPTAQNPTSTAYGLFQFLNSTWGTVGATKTSNPGLQAEAGLRYIKNRYSTPAGALGFHNRNNYYDQGGWMQPGFGTYYNGTTKPEAVLTDQQWKTLAGSARGADSKRELNMNFYGDLRDPVDVDMLAARLEFADRAAGL